MGRRRGWEGEEDEWEGGRWRRSGKVGGGGGMGEEDECGGKGMKDWGWGRSKRGGGGRGVMDGKRMRKHVSVREEWEEEEAWECETASGRVEGGVGRGKEEWESWEEEMDGEEEWEGEKRSGRVTGVGG